MVMIKKLAIIILISMFLISCEASFTTSGTGGDGTTLPDNPAVNPDPDLPEPPEEDIPTTPDTPEDDDDNGNGKTLSDSKARYYLNVAIGEFPDNNTEWNRFVDKDKIEFELEEYPYSLSAYSIYVDNFACECRATISHSGDDIIESANIEATDGSYNCYITGDTIGDSTTYTEDTKQNYIPQLVNTVINEVDRTLFNNNIEKLEHITSFSLTRDAKAVNYSSFAATNTNGDVSHYNIEKMIVTRQKASAETPVEERIELVIYNSFETISIEAVKQMESNLYTILSATVS